MNAPAFDAHSSSCPICRRTGFLKTNKLLTGLLICQQCQERLVVSWSGHYVRDPFRLRQLNIERSLRRGSHPLSRILRDLKAIRPNALVVILVSSLLLGGLSVLFEKLAANPALPTQSSSINAERS